MMRRYPISLDISEKKALVVGGGDIATRKIKDLIEAGANITVISPTISPAIQEWVAVNVINWEKRPYQTGDEEGAFIIIAATNNPVLNAAIAQNSRETQLVNVVDRSSLGNFTVPARVNRGKLNLIVDTGGASPMLAKQIQEALAKHYPEDYEAYLDFLSICREAVKATSYSPILKKHVLKNLLDPSYRDVRKQDEVLKNLHGFIEKWVGNAPSH